MADLIGKDDILNALSSLGSRANNGLILVDTAIAAVNAIKPRIKSPTYIKLRPCTCGSKKRERLRNSWGTGLKCFKCGKETPYFPTSTEAHEYWNFMIERETNSDRG